MLNMKENIKKKEFLVPSGLSEVSSASSKVLSFLKPLALSEAYRFDIRLCLEEALVNAIKYGHGFKKDLKVRVRVEYNHEEVRLTVEDQGRGFDLKKLQDCTHDKYILRGHGRGVYLIHQLMNKVKYNSKGNRIQMVKSLKNPAL